MASALAEGRERGCLSVAPRLSPLAASRERGKCGAAARKGKGFHSLFRPRESEYGSRGGVGLSLVVARILGGRISIASDTMISKQGVQLPLKDSLVKSCILPGGLCVSFTNSPELAARDLNRFVETYPSGAGFAEAVAFFESSSSNTGNEYILAFAKPARLMKVTSGKATRGLARTQWIGEKSAYERFREYEARARARQESGRAVSAVLFADEETNSPASDLYSTFRHVISDRAVPSVGGFVCLVSNRLDGFRYSVYSDMLFDWPEDASEGHELRYEDKIDFGASGENRGYTVAQVASAAIDLNVVGFYSLKGKKLFVYHGAVFGPIGRCSIKDGVEPGNISQALTSVVGADLKWLVMVTSSEHSRDTTTERRGGIAGAQSSSPEEKNWGMGFSIFCHANTFQKDQVHWKVERGRPVSTG